MEQLITQAKKQFDDIVSYVQGQAQSQQLNEVEKGIFYALLKLGMTLLLVFFQQKGTGYKGKLHIDKEGVKRSYHSIKHRAYLSIFGRASIPRACYWRKGCHEIYPLDAELKSTQHRTFLCITGMERRSWLRGTLRKGSALSGKHIENASMGKHCGNSHAQGVY